MRDPLLPSFSGNEPSGDSWLNRIRENLAQLLMPAHFKPSSANGAPIHLLKFDKSLRPARAQGASLLTHAAIFAAVIFIASRVPSTSPPLGDLHNVFKPLGHYTFPVTRPTVGAHPSPGSGSGGDRDPVPATTGDLPLSSAIQIVKPTLPQDQHPVLPEPPTILDPNAPPILTPLNRIGLPWMPNDTNSPGPGDKHGIGTGPNGTLGDGTDGPAGMWNGKSPYGPGFVSAICSYCPLPTYTDDARHVKVQGTVLLQVLVGADGRAQDIRVIKGVGYGLDERAVDTVRGWKFVPAHDSAKHAVASWVTVEAVFRLF